MAHSDTSLRTMHWRAEVNKLQGVESSVIGLSEIKRPASVLDTSNHPATRSWAPSTTHREASSVTTRWSGTTRGAPTLLGVEIHQKTEALDILISGGEAPGGKGPGGKVVGVRTNRGEISAPVVLNCAAGWSTLISDMAGVKLPITTRPLQAAVTEPVKVFLPVVVVSGTLHVYVSQTARASWCSDRPSTPTTCMAWVAPWSSRSRWRVTYLN